MNLKAHCPFLSILCLLAFLFALSADGAEVTVKITDIPIAKGRLLIGLYDSKRNFLKKQLPNSVIAEVHNQDDVVATLKNVSPGIYAIAVIHDLNGDGRLDRNIVGMPKEPLAFSVIKTIPKGRPKFPDCAFKVQGENMQMTIALVTK